MISAIKKKSGLLRRLRVVVLRRAVYLALFVSIVAFVSLVPAPVIAGTPPAGTGCPPNSAPRNGVLFSLTATFPGPGSADYLCVEFTTGAIPSSPTLAQNAAGCVPSSIIPTLTAGQNSGLQSRISADWASACVSPGNTVVVQFFAPPGGLGDCGSSIIVVWDVPGVGNVIGTFSITGPPTVGGQVIPIDKLALLGPYIELASVITATTVLAVVYRRRKEK